MFDYHTTIIQKIDAPHVLQDIGHSSMVVINRVCGNPGYEFAAQWTILRSYILSVNRTEKKGYIMFDYRLLFKPPSLYLSYILSQYKDLTAQASSLTMMQPYSRA